MRTIEFFGGYSLDLVQDSDIERVLFGLEDLQRWTTTRAMYNNMSRSNFINLFRPMADNN